MIARPDLKTQVLVEPLVSVKLAHLEDALGELLSGECHEVPSTPARDVEIMNLSQLPPKAGLSSVAGQARLLHDLASIELQAMELGLRTLAEFKDAPIKFRSELAQVTFEEGQHLRLCLEALEDLGFEWGSFPTHIGLWQAVSSEDSLLDRILIVHRYLEGSGLDASETILRRLSGVRADRALKAVKVIRRDEMSHVQFGSHWYERIAKEQGFDPEDDFVARLGSLTFRLPRRREPISEPLRREAGFRPKEIAALEALRR